MDLPKFLVEELNRYIGYLKEMSLKAGNGGNVDLKFVDPMENRYWPYSQRKMQGFMKRVCSGATKLSIRNPHDLWQTYATNLLMAHRVQHMSKSSWATVRYPLPWTYMVIGFRV